MYLLNSLKGKFTLKSKNTDFSTYLWCYLSIYIVLCWIYWPERYAIYLHNTGEKADISMANTINTQQLTPKQSGLKKSTTGKRKNM